LKSNCCPIPVAIAAWLTWLTTIYMQSVKPEEVMVFLNVLFSLFDKLTDVHRVQKVSDVICVLIPHLILAQALAFRYKLDSSNVAYNWCWQGAHRLIKTGLTKPHFFPVLQVETAGMLCLSCKTWFKPANTLGNNRLKIKERQPNYTLPQEALASDLKRCFTQALRSC